MNREKYRDKRRTREQPRNRTEKRTEMPRERISGRAVRRNQNRTGKRRTKSDRRMGLKERKRRRRRRLLIRRAVVLGMLLALVILLVSLIAVSCRYIMKKPDKQDKTKKTVALDKETGKLLDQYYADFLKEKKMRTGQTEKKPAKKFSVWLYELYKDQEWEELEEKLRRADLRDEDFYEITGDTLHVLSDRYKGWLKDDKTAAKHHIYQKDGGEKEMVSLLFAGDVCLEEEDFVLGYYDEVQDLKKCISP